LFYRLSIVGRARVNLRAAYPEKSPAEIETIVRAMCDNLGRTVAEYAHLDKIGIHGPDARIETGDLEGVRGIAASGKGIIFYSGHLANWEVMPFICSQAGYDGGEVYRPQNNPIVDRWLVKQRMTNGPKDQIAKGPQGTRRIFTLLRRGKMICLLADQKTNEGVPVPFFGREAMTTPAPAALALKLGSALIAAQIERTGGARFRFRYHPPIAFEPSGDHDRDVLALTAALTRKLEEIIRQNPSQWLWIHRRWPTAREQDNALGRRALQSLAGAGVRVDREGSSFN
jgi:KDO2-lipid IV(A) lauroyltransferase